MPLTELRMKHQKHVVSHELLELALECRAKWQSKENSSVRLVHPLINEECAVLVQLIRLELQGFKPRVISHRDFAGADKNVFSEMYIGNAGVIVVDAETPETPA